MIMKNNKQAVDERRQKILNLIKERGEVKVTDLADTFQLSLMTIRRDLQYLEEQGFVSRVHGGVQALDRAYHEMTREKKISFCREKISEYAARFVDDGDTIFINGSRTASSMLKYLGDKNVTVYTNNGWCLEENYPKNISIHLIGGKVHGHVMVGEYVVRNLLSMHADKTFLGCAAVYDNGEYRYDIPTEIGINEAMISRTGKDIFIIADHSKLLCRGEQENIYGSCTYDRIHTLITDDYANGPILDRLQKHGIDIIQVSTK